MGNNKGVLSFLDSLSVRTKLASIPAVLIVAIAGMLTYTIVVQNGQKADALLIDLASRQRMLNQLYVKELFQAREGVRTDIPDTRKMFAQSVDVLLNGGAAVVTLGKEETIEVPPAPDAALAEKLREEKKAIAELLAKGDEFLKLNSSDRSYPAQLWQTRTAIDDLSARVQASASETITLYSAYLTGKIETMIERQIIAGIAVTIFGICFTWIVARRILNPLAEVANVTTAVASGDLTHKVLYAGRDEVGKLGEAVNRMVDDLSKVVSEIRANSEVLASSAEELSASSQEMGGNAEQTSGQANSVSAAAEQVSKNIETVSTATEQMTASIKEIAKNASEAAEVADSAAKVAETTNSTVAKLGESSTEIGNVIKVITSIAEQTNLLALNATIEAARAGEAGKGFAVVANEVKELAKETAKATEDIGGRVQTIQRDAKEAVQTIGQIAAVIKRINDIQNTIASAVEEQTAATKEISRNIAQSAEGSGEIAKNITGVAQAASSTQQSAAASEGAARELTKMASVLQELVGQFRLSSNGHNGHASPKALRMSEKPRARHDRLEGLARVSRAAEQASCANVA